MRHPFVCALTLFLALVAFLVVAASCVTTPAPEPEPAPAPDAPVAPPPGTVGTDAPAAPPAVLDASSELCAEPGATGNEMGVGRYCTPGGGECDGLAADICTVDYPIAPADTPPFCTRTCTSTADCGSGADCYAGPGGFFKACAPPCVGGVGG